MPEKRRDPLAPEQRSYTMSRVKSTGTRAEMLADMSNTDTRPSIRRRRLETSALVIGYAMSRLDAGYLSARGYKTWHQAYVEAADALNEASASFKNLRDEFDPVHPNARRGWHQRPLRPDRQRVLDELQEVSDDALLELIDRIIGRDEDAVSEAIDSLAVTTRVAYNVAERLLTGRLAEEYFLSHTMPLLGVAANEILDLRQSAIGFDFGIRNRDETAIEVKGLKEHRGGIQFTDREWAEAKYRGTDYLLVVVGNLAAEPVARIVPNPHAVLDIKCGYQKTISAVWRSIVDVTSITPAPTSTR